MEISTGALNRKLAKIAAPIALQGVVSATLTMVDNLMVGFLGETELAAVGVGGQLFMIHYLVLFGLVSGTATFAAQFYGTRDMANIRKVVGLAITLLAGLGLVMLLAADLLTFPILSIYTEDAEVKALAARYVWICSPAFLMLAISSPMEMAFRSTQQVRIPLIVSSVVFSSNTILNYIFIFGKLGMPRLGVAGAAVGTICARTLELILNLYFAFRSSNEFRGSISSYFGWDRELVRRVIKNATPTTINEFLWSLGQTMYVAAYNRIGTTAYAAFQAANSIFNIFSFASFSVGDAALILIGEKLGEGDKEKTMKQGYRFFGLGLILGTLSALFIFVFSDMIIGFYKNVSPETAEIAKQLMNAICLIVVFQGTNSIMTKGVLRGGGDTTMLMVADNIMLWILAIPLGILAGFYLKLPPFWIYICLKSDQIVKTIWAFLRLRSKKWIKKISTESEKK